MSRKQPFRMMLEPDQLATLRLIETRVGVNVSEQIRRAIDAYLETQTTVSKAERRKLLRTNDSQK